MLPELLDFSGCGCLGDKIDLAYAVFKKDFLDTPCFLNNIFIDVRNQQKTSVEGREVEEVFWHIVSRKNNNKRQFDVLRAERIAWIKTIFLNHNNNLVKLFYFYEKVKKIRLYLWLYQNDFVVILEKITTSNRAAFIVTSFYVDNQKKRADFQKRYQDYQNGSDLRLHGCEWF